MLLPAGPVGGSQAATRPAYAPTALPSFPGATLLLPIAFALFAGGVLVGAAAVWRPRRPA